MGLGARPVIDVMTRLKVHHMCESGAKQAAIAEKCSISLRSVERILGEPAPTLSDVATEVRADAPRVGRTPKFTPEMVQRIRSGGAALAPTTSRCPPYSARQSIVPRRPSRRASPRRPDRPGLVDTPWGPFGASVVCAAAEGPLAAPS